MITVTTLSLTAFVILAIYSYVKIKKLTFQLDAERLRSDLVSKKEFFENLIDSVADPIFVKNKDHQWLYGNKAFSRVLNRELKDYIGQSDYDIFPKEMADVFWAKDNETLEEHRIVENEEKLMVEGEVRTVITKKTPVSGIEGGTVLIGVIRDITERKQQEETIANLYDLIESSSDLYCFCDTSGRPIFFNHRGLKLGFSKSLDHFQQIFSPEFDLTLLLKQLEETDQWEGEVFLVNLVTKAQVPYWMKVFYVLDETGIRKSLSLVGTDIQERKENEIKMFYASKMASLGEMAGGIAHEINNPLAIISGKSEQLKKYLEAEPINREKVSAGLVKIEETAFRISKIIKGLRSFSRTEELDAMREVVIRDMIEETLDLCRERMNTERITLIQHVDSSLTIKCRPTEIQQVIINLLNNSTDAIRSLPDPWIKITTQVTNSFIIITITDSGKGIPKNVRDRIMDPFFTTKEMGKGTGLGLSISRRIMESNNGNLVYNEQDSNTSFSLIFNT